MAFEHPWDGEKNEEMDLVAMDTFDIPDQLRDRLF